MGRPPQSERLDLASEECGGFRQEISTLLKQLIHFERFKITSRDLPTPPYDLDTGRAYRVCSLHSFSGDSDMQPGLGTSH